MLAALLTNIQRTGGSPSVIIHYDDQADIDDLELIEVLPIILIMLEK